MARFIFVFVLLQGFLCEISLQDFVPENSYVERSVCEDLPTPVNGKIECETDPVTVGKSCKFTCLEGYIRTGSENRICLEEPKDSLHATKWSGTPTLCLPNSAVRSSQPSHNYYGSHRTRHPGAKVLDKFDGRCKHLNCTQLCVKKENGQFRCGCGHGYILNKEDRRSCDRNSGPPIHPKVDPCSLNNGGCDHTCQLTIDNRVRCKCNTGYILAQDRKRCFLSKTSVLRVTCGVRNGGCEHNCSEIGNAIQCSCLPGYRLHDDGKHCVDISCPAFFKPLFSIIKCENGKRRLSEMDRYPFGTACEVTCDIGFTYFGSTYMKCQEDGTWKGRLADCRRQCIDCEDVPIHCDYTGGSHHCSCMSGYEWEVSSRKCIDIDECSNEFLNSCDHVCINTEGSYSCLCEPGYVLIENRKCQGCRKGAYWSPEDHGCVDCPANSYTLSEGMTLVSDCVCRPGFTGSPKHNIPCEDIDECAKNNFGCSHQCINVPGGAFCSCPVGYTTDNDNKTCIDINECSVKNGGCEGLCHNTEGSFRCSCPSGFRTSNKDIYTCEDVDECLEKNGGCEHRCHNYRGGYTCLCKRGSRLDRNLKNCTDISCPGFPTPHFSNIKCNNGKQLFKSEMDSYPFGTVCRVICSTGFKASDSSYIQCQDDGTWNGKLPDCRSQSCPPLQVPEHGDVHPPSCATDGNTVKQTCTFTCRQGYRLKGLAVFNCKNNLTWRQSITDIPVCEPEEIRASIECIRDVSVTLQPGKSSQNVTIPEPVTNMESYEITPKNITVGKPMEFPAGKTNVLFTTRSLSSNRTAECLTTVNVIDEEPPEFISCPNDILIENAKVDGEIVTWEEPMVIDNVGVEFLKSSVEPNSTLKPGSYHVEYIARDGAGNTKSCLFKIDIVRLNCGNLTNPVHGIANCMDWLYGNLCQPECDEGYMRYPSDPSFYSCGDSGVWEPSSVISDCLPYKDAILSTCPDGSELITIDETEEEICLECPPLTPWSPTTRKCEDTS